MRSVRSVEPPRPTSRRVDGSVGRWAGGPVGEWIGGSVDRFVGKWLGGGSAGRWAGPEGERGRGGRSAGPRGRRTGASAGPRLTAARSPSRSSGAVSSGRGAPALQRTGDRPGVEGRLLAEAARDRRPDVVLLGPGARLRQPRGAVAARVRDRRAALLVRARVPYAQPRLGRGAVPETGLPHAGPPGVQCPGPARIALPLRGCEGAQMGHDRLGPRPCAQIAVEGSPCLGEAAVRAGEQRAEVRQPDRDGVPPGAEQRGVVGLAPVRRQGRRVPVVGVAAPRAFLGAALGRVPGPEGGEPVALRAGPRLVAAAVRVGRRCVAGAAERGRGVREALPAHARRDQPLLGEVEPLLLLPRRRRHCGRWRAGRGGRGRARGRRRRWGGGAPGAGAPGRCQREERQGRVPCAGAGRAAVHGASRPVSRGG